MRHSPTTLNAPMLGPMNLPWKNALTLGTPRTLAAEAPLLLQGEEVLDFYYLAQGNLRLMHSGPDGRERTILYLCSGNLFNESTALAGYDAPDCCFISMAPSLIYRFAGALLRDARFIAENPGLIINLMESQAIKILIMHVGLGSTVGHSTLETVSRFILSLMERHHGAREFDPNLTQQDIATLLGLHRASVVRALAELRRLGAIVTFTKHSLKIGDLAMLETLSGQTAGAPGSRGE